MCTIVVGRGTESFRGNFLVPTFGCYFRKTTGGQEPPSWRELTKASKLASTGIDPQRNAYYGSLKSAVSIFFRNGRKTSIAEHGMFCRDRSQKWPSCPGIIMEKTSRCNNPYYCGCTRACKMLGQARYVLTCNNA